MTFHVGQKVVCIKAGSPGSEAAWTSVGARYVRLNGIYTIRAINVWGDGAKLRFVELDNRHLEGVYSEIEPGFRATHFRPIVDRKTDISFAHEILRKAKVPVRALAMTATDRGGK